MRTCTICIHAKQAEIDQQLVAGTSLRNIAQQFETSATALHRHKKHLPLHLVKAEEAAQVADAGTLLDQVKRLLADAQRLTAQAEQAKQLDVALRGIREVRGVLELLGKLSGELQQPGVRVGVAVQTGDLRYEQVAEGMSNEEIDAKLRSIFGPALEGLSDDNLGRVVPGVEGNR